MTETGQESRDNSRESKCPFCGANQMKLHPNENRTGYEGIIDWECGTSWYGENNGYGARGEQCYETEIARLKGLVREMGVEIEKLYEWVDHYERYLMEPILKILSRPEVRAILEER